MRILYHHRTRGRHVEGVHIRGIVDALRGLGHEVSLLSFPGADPEAEREGVPTQAARRGVLAALVTRLPGIAFELLELGYNVLIALRLPRALRRSRAQAIYERYALFMWASVWLARRRGLPIVLEINDSALVERVRPLRMKALARRIERWCMRNASGLVFVSREFRRLAEEAHGPLAPSAISPNAVDASRFDPARFDGDALRAARGLDGRVVCGYVGAFVRWHGTAAFVQAIIPRLREAPRLTLLLVGDGSDLAAVRAQVEAAGLDDRILLPGRVAHEHIGGWIACMDYAVLPDSNRYGSPMKVVEFMAMGVPVVAPDYEPLTELISDGGNGWLFTRRRGDECVDTVLRLARDLPTLRRAGLAARDFIVRERQWRNNARQLLELMAPAESAPAPRQTETVA
ncbi:MAG TPA: glycosyltransferase family 4 protein [Rhodanobacteraceae bacterium]|nr:glycosyltransferase family 4 protein [Rhodanobacteraceae bacterium]